MSVFSTKLKSKPGAADDMHPQVEVTAFEAVYAPPGAELEQEEMLGPGYSKCKAGTRIVRGKVLRLLNPSKHFSIVAPPNACGDATDTSSAGGALGSLFLNKSRDDERLQYVFQYCVDGDGVVCSFLFCSFTHGVDCWRISQYWQTLPGK